MIELLFELDLDGCYSDWILSCDEEDLMMGLIAQEIHKLLISSNLHKINHFSVLVTCHGCRVLSRDLIVNGEVRY